MMNVKYRLKVRSLWIGVTAGGFGAVGAILTDGTPVVLCSRERWNELYAILGPSSSDWTEWKASEGSVWTRTWGGNGKVIEVDRPEETFRQFGLGRGKLELAVPKTLIRKMYE